MDDNHEAQKTSWGNVARSLIGVLLGGLLVIAGGVVTSTLNRDNTAEARREERAAEAYSAMLSDLTKAAIDLGQWRGRSVAEARLKSSSFARI